MQIVKNVFTDHPHSVGETYLQHLYFASKFGIRMLIGGVACIIHAILPFLFKKTASNLLLTMTNDFITRMPVVDESVITIGRLIDKKLGQQPTRSPISASMMQIDYESQKSQN